MEKLATADDDRAPCWASAPDWYLWESGLFALGRAAGAVPPHAHRAIQVVVAVEGTIGIRSGSGVWRWGNAVVVKPDVVHSYDGNGAIAAMIFVDPASFEGVWQRSSLPDDITLVPASRLVSCCGELRQFLVQPLESPGITALICHWVKALSLGAPPARRLDERVTRVLASIRLANKLQMSIEEAAAMASLSPSRFAHLFKQQVGLSFRRYMLWRKLSRAMVAMGHARTITAAAHAADFSDTAHLTRTFYRMFGLPPSVMMQGDPFEILSPFAATDAPRSGR